MRLYLKLNRKWMNNNNLDSQTIVQEARNGKTNSLLLMKSITQLEMNQVLKRNKLRMPLTRNKLHSVLKTRFKFRVSRSKIKICKASSLFQEKTPSDF